MRKGLLISLVAVALASAFTAVTSAREEYTKEEPYIAGEESLPMAEAEEKQFLSDVRKNLPQIYREWKRKRSGRAGEADEGGRLRKRLREINPEVRELGTRCRELAKEYASAATETAKEEVKTKLQENLERLFDTEQKSRSERIEKMKETLKNLEQKVLKRGKNKAEVVEHKLKNLLHPGEFD